LIRANDDDPEAGCSTLKLRRENYQESESAYREVEVEILRRFQELGDELIQARKHTRLAIRTAAEMGAEYPH